jgi:putrescine transport system substrate-binding protein
MTITRRSALALVGGAATLAMPYVKRASAEEGVVHIFNWTDYIGETTLEDFEAATGLKPVYDTYDSTEAMEAKMLAGSTGYDVVLQAGSTLARFVEANIYAPLDKSRLPGLVNLDPDILKVLEGWDPGNKFGVPYMWGTVGITYNVDMVRERIPNADFTSLDLLFKPENAAKLADCGISVLESPGDVIPLVLAYLGKDPNTTNPEDFQAVVEAFKPIRQYIKAFDSSNYLNAIPNKELCYINNWSGDYATAKARAEEAGIQINLEYHVPKTGSPAWFDIWCIPADAPNKDGAHAFINYLLDPEVIAKCTNFTNYANANKAADKFVDPKVLADPAVYPDAELRKRLWTQKSLSQELERARTRAWSDIKTGSGS